MHRESDRNESSKYMLGVTIGTRGMLILDKTISCEQIRKQYIQENKVAFSLFSRFVKLLNHFLLGYYNLAHLRTITELYYKLFENFLFENKERIKTPIRSVPCVKNLSLKKVINVTCAKSQVLEILCML